MIGSPHFSLYKSMFDVYKVFLALHYLRVMRLMPLLRDEGLDTRRDSFLLKITMGVRARCQNSSFKRPQFVGSTS